MSVTAVPRSGCRAIRMNGTAAIAPAMSRSSRVMAPRRLSPKNFASTSASAALANSDGCRLSDAEIDPAPRSAAHRAEKQDVHQEQQNAEVNPVRLVGQRPIVDASGRRPARQCRSMMP